MATTSAQSQGRKIRPINHPSLVLKSPIAYHGESDLSVLPIDKDGIAVCEKCGAIGVKHTFYTRQRKFCSVTCARGYTGYYSSQKTLDDSACTNGNAGEDRVEDVSHYRKQANYKFKLMESSDHLVGMIPMEPLPRLPGSWQATLDDFPLQSPSRGSQLAHSYQWADHQLFRCDFLAAPVKLFSHAPLSDMWDNVFEGMKVEVKNTDCDNLSPKLSDYFWVASVLKLKGYMGLLRYEGFGNDDSKDFWVNLMNWEVHPVGWCATRGKPLIPPHTIENKYSDWKTFLVRQLTGARTLPTDFYNKINESLKSRFRLGHILEVVDKNRLSQVKVAIVDDIVEKRLHVRYYDSTPENMSGFWCHEDSPLIHPVGWARSVGHELDAPFDYLQRLNGDIAHLDDTTPEMFKKYVNADPHNINLEIDFIEGTKLEAIDPLNLSSVCEATVMRVLLHGYIMIRIDCYPPDEAGADWFCYYKYSPYIFPAGFCEERGIALTVSLGEGGVWQPRPVGRVPSLPPPHHGFVSGMRLECVDLMEPRLVCVATIARVVGRLLKVHFDGWGDEYDQWLDCESTDIYPVGWCRAVGHKLEGPPSHPQAAVKPTPQPRKRGRRKRGAKTQQGTIADSLELSNGNNGSYYPEKSEPLANDMIAPNVDDPMKENMENLSKQEAEYAERNTDVKLPIKIEENTQEDTCSAMETEESIKTPTSNYDNTLTQETDSSFQVDTEDAESHLTTASSNNIDAMEVTNNEPQEEAAVTVKQEVKKSIPRLVGNIFVDLSALNSVHPESWEPQDVEEFLSINDCAPYSGHFSQVSGQAMLDLTKDDIIELLQMKVGPSLKIFDLIQQLKCKLKPAHARLKLYK